MIEAWGGGTYDTTRNRLMLWGGGHNDYYGNEVYAFDVPSFTWLRLTNPDLDFELYMDCAEKHASGNPRSRHTYGGLLYLPTLDRLWAHGGALACGAGGDSDSTWLFDPNTNTWLDTAATGTISGGYYSTLQEAAVFDSLTNQVYLVPGSSQLARYDVAGNSWSELDDAQSNWGSRDCAIDPVRRILICIGQTDVWAYDLTARDFTRVDWETTGGDLIVNDTSGIGLDYDPVTDRMVAWNGGAVYSLNMDTRIWTAKDPVGSPPGNSAGIYGRWTYIPAYNVFMVVTRADDNVYFYKNSAGGGGDYEFDVFLPLVNR